MSAESFLAALHASRQPRVVTCPATALTVTIRVPSQREVLEAHARVDIAWKKEGREVTALNVGSYQDDKDLAVLSMVAMHDGALLGAAVLGALSEEQFAFYVDQMEQLREEAEPELDGRDVDALLAELKKKPTSSAGILNSSDSKRLRAFVRCLADRLSKSQTLS
jgi:hypothetical protein